LLRDYGYRAAKRWWTGQGGQRDFIDPASHEWRQRIEQRFIDPHHWDARTAPARQPDVARASVDALSAAMATPPGSVRDGGGTRDRSPRKVRS
jgi:hypothetical protein